VCTYTMASDSGCQQVIWRYCVALFTCLLCGIQGWFGELPDSSPAGIFAAFIEF
jgi:hypothetical protein